MLSIGEMLYQKDFQTRVAILFQGGTSIMDQSETIQDNDKTAETNGTVVEEKNESPAGPVSAVDVLKIRQKKIQAKKVMISELVSSILEDPQVNVSQVEKCRVSQSLIIQRCLDRLK